MEGAAGGGVDEEGGCEEVGAAVGSELGGASAEYWGNVGMASLAAGCACGCCGGTLCCASWKVWGAEVLGCCCGWLCAADSGTCAPCIATILL